MPSRNATPLALVALATLLATDSAVAQQLTMPSDPLAGTVISSSDPAPGKAPLTPNSVNAVPMGGDIGMGMGPSAPGSTYASGSYFNPTLGSHIRATYTSNGYGLQDGLLSLGSMMLFGADEGMTFIDGQVNMSDNADVGYNVGLGYRWMTLPLLPFSPDAQKIMGVSIWSDGLSKSGDNFFPQVGVSLESLGDHIDFRANGYAPVGQQTQTRDFFETGALTYSGNTLASQLQGVADTALTVGEAEVAGRIADLDAWVFGGVYGFNGGEFDGVGGKVGLRGYATPDLMISIAVANDDEFDTNTMLNLTWFVGRTRVENCPRGELRDRFRQPVLRNNYVALQQSVAFSTGGPVLDANGQPFDIVHVDSTAAAGGDGTFERPLNSLDNLLTNSQTGDIVLAHGGSVFTGQSATLQSDQTFVGEGGNNSFSVMTSSGSTVNLPETSPGAMAGPIPQINGSQVNGLPGAGVVLADNNTVQNLSFNGGVNAITTDAVNGSNNSTLQDLTIANTTGNAINLVAAVVADTDDVDNDGNTTELVNLLGTVAIDNVTFSGNGGNDIAINGDATGAQSTLAEAITISNVTSSGAANPSIAISNTTSVTGSATNITNYSYNGGTTGGGLLLTNTGSATTVTESDFTGGNAPAVAVNGSTGTVTVGSTNTIDDVTGTAVSVIGNTAAVNIGAAIDTANTVTGGGVFVEDNEGIVSFTGAITANGVNAVELNDTKANVTFGNAADITHTGAGNAMLITNAGSNTTNTAQVTVSGDITNSGGRAVQISGGDGAITFNGVVNDTGTGVSITDRENVATSVVVFNGQTTLTTGGNDALTLANNGALSATSFSNLDITTTGAGNGIVGNNSGVLNITGTGNTIATATGRAIDLTGGSSGNGIIFQSVNVNGADRAILLSDFNGVATVNGGTMTTTGQTIQTENAGLVLNDVVIDSGADQAISVTVNNATNRTVTLTDIDANGGDLTLRTGAAAAGAITATVNNTGSTAGAAGQFGEVVFDSNGSGNSSLSMTEVRTDGGFNYDVDGAGNLSTTMTNVTSSGAGATTLDVTSTGNGILTMNNVNTGGTIAANSTAGADGDLIVSVSNSGNTTAFGPITFNDLGDGVATASFTNSRSTGGIDFDAARSGNASLTVSGGEYGGDITATAANTLTGSFTARVTNGAAITGTGSQVIFDAQNTGQVTYQVSGLSFNTGASVPAIDLNLGANVTTADVTVSGNSGIDGVETLAASVLELDIAAGVVDFLLSGNNFTNNAGAGVETVRVINNGTTLNATLTSNTLENGGAGGELLLQNASGSVTNLSASTNGPTGAAYVFDNLSAQDDFNVRGANAAAVQSANPANITFTGLFDFDSNLVVPTP